MLTTQDLYAIRTIVEEVVEQKFEEKLNVRFQEFEERLDKKIDAKFDLRFKEFEERFEKKLDKKLDDKLDKRFKKELTPLRQDIKRLRREINLFIRTFDEEHMNLQRRMIRVEDYLHLPKFIN